MVTIINLVELVSDWFTPLFKTSSPYKDEHAIEFIDWMNNRLIVESQSSDYALYREWQNVEEDVRIIEDPRFLDILRMVDYSICDIEVDEEKPFRV